MTAAAEAPARLERALGVALTAVVLGDPWRSPSTSSFAAIIYQGELAHLRRPRHRADAARRGADGRARRPGARATAAPVCQPQDTPAIVLSLAAAGSPPRMAGPGFGARLRHHRRARRRHHRRRAASPPGCSAASASASSPASSRSRCSRASWPPPATCSSWPRSAWPSARRSMIANLAVLVDPGQPRAGGCPGPRSASCSSSLMRRVRQPAGAARSRSSRPAPASTW